jgi:hypothetical protein
MSLLFGFHDEPGYLNVDLTGEWNLDDLKSFAKALHLHVRESGHKNILIDALKTNTPPDTGSSFFYGE